MNVENETRFDELKTKALLLQRENVLLVDHVVRLRKENIELRGLSPEQLQQELLLLDKEMARAAAALDAKAAEIDRQAEREARGEKQERKPRDRSGPRPQPALPVVELTHDLDKPDQQCPSCGGSLSHFGDDVTEEIDLIERRFVKTRHVVKKYACRCKSCVETADMPPRLVPGGLYSNNFAVEVAAMKYVDQLPFDRIARIFGREGLVIDSQTIWDQVDALAKKLQPAWSALRDAALAEGHVGLDQTHWKVIGHKKSWQMWELSRPRIAYFDIAESKGEKDGARILSGYSGVVVCDALVTHESLVGTAGITLAHCWAHVRRYARDLTKSDPMRAQALIDFIRLLYDAEDEAGDDVEKRRALRAVRSRKIVDDIYAWRLEQRVLPSSPTGKLLCYLANHERGFRRFLDDPLVDIDNNRAERGYLWPAIGRRSFIGSKSKRGTQVAAVFYSLAESARRNGADPKGYLKLALDEALAGRAIPLPHQLAK